MQEEQKKRKQIWRQILVSIVATIATLVIIYLRDRSTSWIVVFIFVYYFVLLSISEGIAEYSNKRFWYTLVLSVITATISTFLWSDTPDFLTSLGTTIIGFPIMMIATSTICALYKGFKYIKKRREIKENQKHWKKLFNREIEPTDRESLIMKAVKWWKDELSHNIKQETEDAVYNSFFDTISENRKELTKKQIDSFGVELAHAISESKEDYYSLRVDWHPCGVLYDIARKLKISHLNFPVRMAMSISFKSKTISIRHLDDPEWIEI